jgi:hypothetical protein
MSTFTVKSKWMQSDGVPRDELEATISKLQIYIGRSNNITEHSIPRAKAKADALFIPLYFLAEWIAENWWVLLFEPRKDEESDDTEYLSRHSIVAAQHGFPLPDLSIVPFGRSFHLNAAPRVAPFANVKFTVSAFADVARDEVERVLSTFLDDNVARLAKCGVERTPLTDTWNEIKSSGPEERAFCELVGSLGLSPKEISDELGSAIEQIYKILGPLATRDFCLAATKEVVLRSIQGAEDLTKFLEKTKNARLTSILDTGLPQDNYSGPAYRRGLAAAKALREKLKIEIKDPSGADKLFDALHIDTTIRYHMPKNDMIELPFSGAVDRDNDKAKIALLQEDELNRRFSAGRAAYLAWVSEPQSRRLVTTAVTRDQQASRQFAAEMLVPQAYLKSLAYQKGQLHPDQVREAARNRRATPDVAFKQAYNAALIVRAI